MPGVAPVQPQEPSAETRAQCATQQLYEAHAHYSHAEDGAAVPEPVFNRISSVEVKAQFVSQNASELHGMNYDPYRNIYMVKSQKVGSVYIWAHNSKKKKPIFIKLFAVI